LRLILFKKNSYSRSISLVFKNFDTIIDSKQNEINKFNIYFVDKFRSRVKSSFIIC